MKTFKGFIKEGLGFATFTPKPHAKENPTKPKSKGVNKDGGS